MLAKRGQGRRASRDLDLDVETELIYGAGMASALRGSRPAPTPEELRAAWARHRDRLMRPEEHDLPAGQRPWGWWRFDLGVASPPLRACESIPLLLDRGLIDADEAARIERGDGQLGQLSLGRPGPPYPAAILAEHEPDRAKRRHANNRRLAVARCAAVWHARRGRQSLAASWASTVCEIEAALRADL